MNTTQTSDRVLAPDTAPLDSFADCHVGILKRLNVLDQLPALLEPAARARRIARAIVAARPITRTGELAQIVRRATGYKPHDKKDPATRTFQAIRIHLNRELGELEDGLVAAERALKPGGRLAVVTFHSLEDRIVKRFLRDRSGAAPQGSRHLPGVPVKGPEPSFEAVGKAVRPGEAELARNPRARSATLRVARRTAAPAREDAA